jgi:uncharacterized RDD family membrane protein YckC
VNVPPAAAAHPRSVITTENLQGHYAGFVSRFAGFAADAGVSTSLFLAGLAATTFALGVITGHTVTWTKSSPIVFTVYVVWLFIYYAYSWGAFSRTFGMALLGVRVVRADGDGISPRRAVMRTLAFPFSFILGLGFIPVLLRQDRRALHDLIAGTAVIYSWDARGARLRFLAHK